MFRHVPNLLTGARLVLAAFFFAMLSYYQYTSREEMPYLKGHYNPLWLNIAFGVYLVALATDFLDGYLARRWKVEGTFGRIVDPFVDKVLVLGSFIFFAGKNFTVPYYNPEDIPSNVITITGVTPWMVVVILARELLVTSLRGMSESGGIQFGAAFSGKLKMVMQSLTVLVILLYVNNLNWLLDKGYERWHLAAFLVRQTFIWSMLAVTIGSGLLYLRRASGLLGSEQLRVASCELRDSQPATRNSQLPPDQ